LKVKKKHSKEREMLLAQNNTIGRKNSLKKNLIFMRITNIEIKDSQEH